MDNRDGKFVEKLVFFYLSGYVAESWAMSEAEIEKYDEQAQNITSSLQTVDNQVRHLRGYVQSVRGLTDRCCTIEISQLDGADYRSYFKSHYPY